MQNAKIVKYFVPALLLIGVGCWFYGNQYNLEKKDQELLIKKELLKNTSEVWDLWVNGKDARLYAASNDICKNEIKSNDRCSLNLLSCILPKSNLRINRKGKNKIEFFKIVPIDKNSSGEIIPTEGARVVMGIEEIKLTLLLEASCHKLFLPKRNYAFGFKKNPDWTKQFDTFERNIFIDKEMTEVMGRTFPELQKHCASRGMQLLESHILDAASIHPVDLRNNRPKYFLQPPLPWTRNFKSEYVYSAQNDVNFLFEKKYCKFIFSQECKGQENSSLPSWMGLRNPLGSLIEVVRNPNGPKQKIIPSSTYFSVKSKWHHLGKRASWTGDSYHRDDFDFAPFKSPVDDRFDELRLGFRCMQEEFLN